MIKCKKEIVSCDFLIIGGGMGGLEAAVTAAELGVDTIVLEKANTKRSGSGANGNDHFDCYIPFIHGDFEVSMKEIGNSMDGGPWVDEPMTEAWVRQTWPIIQEWESFGIEMRPTGEWHFEGHGRPGEQLHNLKFNGALQKPILTKVAKERGVRIMNHTVVNELLLDKDGRFAGVVALDISEEEPVMVIYQAKSALIATGMNTRLFPSLTPTYMFNTPGCPSTVGSGMAMAWRAGAKMINFDILGGHAGPSYFARGGKGTWIGLSCDIDGKPLLPGVDKPDRAMGDVVADKWPGCYRERMEQGLGPTYMNTTLTKPEDLDYMLHYAMVSEGIDSITDYCEQHDIDLSKVMVEFASYPKGLAKCGIECGTDASTSIPGLFCAGVDMGNVGGSLAGAVGFGKIAAMSAAEYVKTADMPSVEGHPLIEKCRDFYSMLMERTGAEWMEAASTVQNIMNDYLGKIMSETTLRAAKAYSEQIKTYMYKELGCSNSHELMRTLEVFDMADLMEPTILSCMNRKESRAPSKRADFPEQNPAYDGLYQTIQKMPDGRIEQDFRKRILR